MYAGKKTKKIFIFYPLAIGKAGIKQRQLTFSLPEQTRILHE